MSIQKKDALIFIDLHQNYNYNEYSKTDKYNLFKSYLKNDGCYKKVLNELEVFKNLEIIYK
jgi:hypothetical protein